MNAKRIGLLALGLVAVLSAGDLTAQERRGERGPAMRGPGVERIMALRERLELTESQIATLDGIRAEEVRRRSAMRAELEELRSRVQAGQARRSEVMAYMEERQEAREAEVELLRERVEAVLAPEQLEELEQIRAEARAFERGRRAGGRGFRARDGLDRGPGVRGERGFQRRGLRGGTDSAPEPGR